MANETKSGAKSRAMTVEMWPITRILPYEMNARKIPRSAVDKVAASLKEYGWRQPIVVDAAGVWLTPRKSTRSSSDQ